MSNKHMPHDLAQMQSLPLRAKIIMTQQRIRQWYEYWDGLVYVAVSGLDSTVLKHIIDGMYSDVPAVYVDAGLEYPEIRKFWKDVKAGKYDCFNSDVEIIRPEMRFDGVIKKYGYPVFSKEIAKNIEYGRKALERGDTEKYERYVKGKRTNKKTGEIYYYMGLSKLALKVFDSHIPVSNMCCKKFKKEPSEKYEKRTGRKAFIGTQAQESKERKHWWIKNGCNAFYKKRPTSQPISFWTKQDVYHYIKEFDVPYCSVYGDIVMDEKVDGENILEGQNNMFDYMGNYSESDRLKTTGCDRTGCIYCMFGCHQEDEPNRFQRLKQTHPRQYKYCIGGGEYNEEGKWQPSKEGLGLGKVLDYIGVKYD